MGGELNMKLFNYVAVTVTVLGASAAFGQGPYHWYYKLYTNNAMYADQLKEDVKAIKLGISDANVSLGSATKTMTEEKARVIKSLEESAVTLYQLGPRVADSQKHFEALRTALLSKGRVSAYLDDPNDLETFCSQHNITDLSVVGQRKFIADAYESEASKMDGIKNRLEPAANKMWTENQAWKLQPTVLEAGMDPKSSVAQGLIEADQAAQRFTHRKRVVAQQKLYDAVTHAGWAAKTIRNMEKPALADFDKFKHSNLAQNDYLLTKAGNMQNTCKETVASIRRIQDAAKATAPASDGKKTASNSK